MYCNGCTRQTKIANSSSQKTNGQYPINIRHVTSHCLSGHDYESVAKQEKMLMGHTWSKDSWYSHAKRVWSAVILEFGKSAQAVQTQIAEVGEWSVAFFDKYGRVIYVGTYLSQSICTRWKTPTVSLNKSKPRTLPPHLNGGYIYGISATSAITTSVGAVGGSWTQLHVYPPQRRCARGVIPHLPIVWASIGSILHPTSDTFRVLPV